jgi:hypothetical protein
MRAAWAAWDHCGMATELTVDGLTEQWQSQFVSIGMIVGQGAMLDRALEQAFCALVGSKYAAVVASAQSTSWLIDHCAALAKARADIADVQRRAIKTALRACERASKRRNDLVHAMVAHGGLDVVMAVMADRMTHKVTVKPWTLDELRGVAGELARAHHGLMNAVEAAVGPQSLQLWYQLRQEDAERAGVPSVSAASAP